MTAILVAVCHLPQKGSFLLPCEQHELFGCEWMLALESEISSLAEERKRAVVATRLWPYLLPLVLLSWALFCDWIWLQLTGSYFLFPLLPGHSHLL